LRAKIGDDAKDGAGHIENMAKPADKVSADFSRNPGAESVYQMTTQGLARILAHGFVAHLVNIDILAAARFAP
jgi:hypothetical protein